MFWGINDNNAREIVEKGPSVARAFSAISRALLSLIPNKRNINHIIVHSPLLLHSFFYDLFLWFVLILHDVNKTHETKLLFSE